MREPGPLYRAGIVALQCFIVLISIAVTAFVASGVQERSIRAVTEERVLDVAQSLAALTQVKQVVGEGDIDAGIAALQPLADTVGKASGVAYVVITDDEGIRFTHPSPEERGKRVSTDPSPALGGEVFIGTETGTLGTSLRAKVPVQDGDVVIGTVSVGILESDIAASFEGVVFGMLPWIALAAVLGCLAAALVTGMLNRRVRALAAEARETRTQRRIAGALREQTHEFHTRLHVVRGLVAQGEVSEVLSYIDEVVPVTGAPAAEWAVAGLDGGVGADPRLRALLEGLATELRGLGAELSVAGSLPEGVVPDGFPTVLTNLARNAAEAGARTVQVRWDGERVFIDDDGPGIPLADQARLFQRGATTKADATGFGRGLGLHLVWREVQQWGGTVEVGSSPRGGARFTVTVPVAGSVAGSVVVPKEGE